MSCPGYTFFLGLTPRSHPWTDFNRLWLKWRVLAQGCAFWEFGWWPTILRGSNPPKTPEKGAWLGIFQPNWQNHKIAIFPAGKIGSTQNFDTVIGPHAWLRGWSRMAKFQFKMADGRHIGKCWRCYIYGPIWTKVGWPWSHPIMSPTCPPWCGCHGNGRYLATAHWAFSSYGRLEAERVNQFWWNLVHDSKLRPQWQSRDRILKFLKFKMADSRHVGKYWKCHNSPIMDRLGRNLGGRIKSCPRHFRNDAVVMVTVVA